MNSTETILSTLVPTNNCSLSDRVYTNYYLFFKYLNYHYLRILIGPGVLLNTLCLIVLSRPRLSNKSTTIFFLRFLAIFDILAIVLKYLRAELNYQSTIKMKEISFITVGFCKALYVCMNTCISIAMWTIVLMSVDKAIAVIYPLKSSIWLTHKRASYICYITSLILFLANLPFISFATQNTSGLNSKSCGLDSNKDPLVLDIITASILPIALITAANIVIAVTLHRISRTSFNWSRKEAKVKSNSSELEILKVKNRLRSNYRQTSPTVSLAADTSQASRRRHTSAQVTRMLFAVTVSLILFNIPNTATFFFTKKNGTQAILRGRDCQTVSDDEISLYQISFYTSVTQDILSDLPHIVNFFLYCLAGKKFRCIILDEVLHCLSEFHIIRRRPTSSNHNYHVTSTECLSASNITRVQERLLKKNSLSPTTKQMNIRVDDQAIKLTSSQQDGDRTTDDNVTDDEDNTIRIYSSLH
ncbi:hypothetical protein I4U23_013640 [Adineta vaga]|nr:hypothetical protein I4U23_013640 [Adineta vaga]